MNPILKKLGPIGRFNTKCRNKIQENFISKVLVLEKTIVSGCLSLVYTKIP